MNLVDAVILGLVEGITEYLPVSSTGHLIIAGDLLGLGQGQGAEAEARRRALDAFNIVIQGGAILAVAGLYFPRFLQMVRGLLGQDRAGLRMVVNVIVAFLPAAVIGLALHDLIERYLFSLWPVVAALVVGGVYMILVELWRERRAAGATGLGASEAGAKGPSAGSAVGSAAGEADGRRGGHLGRELADMTWRDALVIGCLQVVAMWPGTSRSMMTITGGYLVGLKPAAAAEFSFLLGMPTLLAATGLALAKNLWTAHKAGEPNLFEVLGPTPVVVGLVVAAVSAALAVRWLVGFLTRHGLVPFGVYRIAAGLVLAGLALMGWVTVD